MDQSVGLISILFQYPIVVQTCEQKDITGVLTFNLFQISKLC